MYNGNYKVASLVYIYNVYVCSKTIFSPVLRTDTQIMFSLHFTPLGIRLSAFVAQPGAFLVLETIILGHYSTHCLK